MTPVSARRKFAEIIHKEGGPKAVALRLGISENHVLKIKNGKRGMTVPMARAIQTLWGMKMEEWAEEPRLETVTRVAVAAK